MLLALASFSYYGSTFTMHKTQDATVQAIAIPEMPQDISPLLIGETIPQITLPDADKKSININMSLTKKPAILIFYRGGWCPYCSAQLSGMMDIEEDLKKTGYDIIAISTDSPENLKQTEMKEKMGYTLLSDSNLAISKQFGIAFKAPKEYEDMLVKASGNKNIDKLLPVPSVFIVDKNGKIRFEYINPNFKERISPSLLKAAANAVYKEM